MLSAHKTLKRRGYCFGIFVQKDKLRGIKQGYAWQARYNTAYADKYRYWNTDYTGSWAPVFTNTSSVRAPYINNNAPTAALEEHHCAAGLADGYAYAGSIVNINPKNLTRDFTAVGYVAYFDGAEWVYLYSATSCTRDVTEVAQLAVDSGDYANDADALTILKALGAVIAE